MAEFADWALVTAVIDRLIPADDHPSASQAGVAGQLATQAATDQRQTWRDLLGPGLTALAAEAGPRGFAALVEDEQDTLLAAIAARRTSTAWPVDPAAFHATLLRLTCEHYYGTRGAAGWHMLGYSPALRRHSGAPAAAPDPLEVGRLADAACGYDAIVVGAGAGGGVAAAVLAEAGLKRRTIRAGHVRIATCDHIHAVPGLLGGVLANEVVKLPILHWNWALPPDAPRWGLAGKRAMARLYRTTSHLFGPIQEIPNPDARVTLAEPTRDRHGVPVARIGGALHPDNRGSADLLIARAQEWLTEAGAERVWSWTPRRTSPTAASTRC